MPRRLAILLALVLAACGRAAGPVPIETGTACAFCRMTISNTHLAAEVVSPGEEPRQYDDIGCLVNDLRQRPAGAAARAFVADYASAGLVPAGMAAYTRVESVTTPMSSHLVAHATPAAREADARVRGGTPLTAADVFAASLPGGPDAK